MEARAAGDHTKPAARYVVSDARYGGRSNRSHVAAQRPTAGVAAPVPVAAAPSTAASSASMQRPRIRMRRAPSGALRYEAPPVYNDAEATPSAAAAAELEFDDDFQLDEELKMDFDRSVRAHRRPQRIKYVKCKTRVLPDLLVPYLYAGDRRSRMNAIMDRTGCTIDYCPESPDDDMDMLRPQRVGNYYLMCFLVAAETSGQLEAATRLLHVLVDRVQVHVEYKLEAGSMRRNSEAETTPRQESRDVQSQHASSRRREDAEYNHLDAISSDHLKAESVEGTESTGVLYGDERLRATASLVSSPDRGTMNQVRDVRWIGDTEAMGASIRHDQLHNHARGRQPSTRYHRPVYRRVLVDEDGYEVYEHPQFEHLQSYSPQLGAHASSPLLRRRRVHEPIYHHDSSSEGENHERRSSAMPMRSRVVTQRGVSRMPMRVDPNDHSTRRGMKRRLEPYEVDEMYPRHRILRRGSMSHDYLSDDLSADYLMSGDEAVDDAFMEASSPLQRRHPVRMPSTNSETQASPSINGKLRTEEVRADALHCLSDPDKGMEKSQFEQVGDESTTTAEHSSTKEATLVPIQTKAVGTSTDADESNGSVTTSVSIVFNEPGESGVHHSDTESIAEVAIAPSVMANGISLSSSPSEKMVCDQGETTQEGDTTFGMTSATRETSPVDAPMRDSEEDTDTKSDEKIGEERADVHADVAPVSVVEPLSASTMAAMKSEGPVSARAKLNEVIINRLGLDTLAHSNGPQIRSRLVAAANALAELIDEARSYERMQDLAHAVYRVQVEIEHLPMVSDEGKKCLLAALDDAMKNAADSSKPATERVMALLVGLEKVMFSDLLRLDEERAPVAQLQESGSKEVSVELLHAVHPTSPDEVPHQTRIMEQVQDAETVNSGLSVLAKETSSDKAHLPSRTPQLNIPLEAPTFVSGLVAELERTTGLSPVMASAQKRLLREISKSDPYYYLHPMVLLESARKGRGSTCPFGCAGASAHKWERKVVSQISSRMKWFDSVAYSLAKVSGGKELLSRKKMNSTIRKLHLVALQLHCLIAHLFCVRKRVVCREIDSLPTALNNSYYEKRMNGYKSRLKLTLHQQLPPTNAGISLPTEELVRDTFEFYPELLLSIDVWGYDYRHDEAPAAKLPADLLRAAARQSFDFETDTNGLLQGICEELLGILCLWNDFKWGESLESLSTDDIVEFEAKVKTSIRKILEAHASHLLSQWSSQLSSTPVLLKHIRLTQTNVYYSEQPISVGTMPGSILANRKSLLFRRPEEDEEEYNEDDKEEEDSVLQDFWRNRFTPSNSSSDAEASDFAKPDTPPLNLSHLCEDTLVNTARSKTDRVLSWTQVYDLRQKCHMLVGSADSLLREESDHGDGSDDTVDADVFSLLERLARAKSMVENAITTSEKLVMHSIHHQLDDADTEKSVRDASTGAGSLADVESMSDNDSRDEEDVLVDALLSGSHVKDGKRQVETPEKDEQDDGEDAWKQPVLKDLVEIVSSTNQEMIEICGQRARSARVRDKLQSQSLDLARQSIQIFQTILNMKP